MDPQKGLTDRETFPFTAGPSDNHRPSNDCPFYFQLESLNQQGYVPNPRIHGNERVNEPMEQSGGAGTDLHPTDWASSATNREGPKTLEEKEATGM